MEKFDACLVSMPCGNIQMPSLALGLLQSSLIENCIKTKSIYASLMFSEKIGLNLYMGISIGDPYIPVVDWAFSFLAFPNFKREDSIFIEELYKNHSQIIRMDFEAFSELIIYIKEKSEEFIQELAEGIIEKSPKIVACSSSIIQKVPSLALMKRIKEMSPKTITVMGGADCETVMGLGIHQNFPWVDYVISGEGEDIIAALFKDILKYGRDIAVERLPIGIIGPRHRDIDYKSVKDYGIDKFRAVSDTFFRQIMPSYDDYFELLKSLPNSSENIVATLPIQASRGCWHGKCKFCGLNAPQIPYRSRPWKMVIDEMDRLSSKYEIKRFEFLDNILDMNYFNDLIPELISRNSPYKMFFEIKSNLEKRHFRMLSEAGTVMCQPGIESLSTGALSEMRKGVAAWQNIQTLKWGRSFGINLYWSILCNFPNDKDCWYQEMADLIPLITHLEPPKGMLDVNYQRYSHYFDEREKYGLNLLSIPIYSHIFPLERDEIENISYVLEDIFYASKKRNSEMAVLFNGKGIKNLKKAIFKWQKSFNKEGSGDLTMEVFEKNMVIKDFRSVALSEEYMIEGILKNVYLECQNAVKEDFIYEKYPDFDIKNVIKFFINNKLMVKVDGRLISLAVENKGFEYNVCPEKNPMGHLKI